MEQKLKRIFNVTSELKVNNRYNLSQKGIFKYSFIVTDVANSGVWIKYYGGMIGLITRERDDLEIYEHPFSSLEMELM
jgi:hypothetical protein